MAARVKCALRGGCPGAFCSTRHLSSVTSFSSFEPVPLAPGRHETLLRIFDLENEHHLGWRIITEAGLLWRNPHADHVARAGDRGLFATADIEAGAGLALWPGVHVSGRGGGPSALDLATHDRAPPGFIDASSVHAPPTPTRCAHLVRKPPPGVAPNVVPAAFRWRDVHMGDDDAVPLNQETNSLFVGGDGPAHDPAGAVLVALRPLAPGEELLFDGAPPDDTSLVLDAEVHERMLLDVPGAFAACASGCRCPKHDRTEG